MAEKVNMPSQKKEKKKKRKKKLPSDFYDYNLLACTILLVSFGLIMLYSASAYEAASTFKGNDMYYFTHQAGLSAIVLVGIVILSKFVDIIVYGSSGCSTGILGKSPSDGGGKVYAAWL